MLVLCDSLLGVVTNTSDRGAKGLKLSSKKNTDLFVRNLMSTENVVFGELLTWVITNNQNISSLYIKHDGAGVQETKYM